MGIDVSVLAEIIHDHKRLQKNASERRLRRMDPNRYSTPERRAARKKWRDAHRAQSNAVRRLWRQRNLVKHLLYGAKARAKIRGEEFSITEADVPPMGDRCPLLGHPFAEPGSRAFADTPSLDRIDSSLGYVRGNVWIVGWRANLIKNDGTAAEHAMIAEAMRARGCK